MDKLKAKCSECKREFEYDSSNTTIETTGSCQCAACIDISISCPYCGAVVLLA